MAQWDWGPVADGLNGLMAHFAQKKQYENLLKTLGTGMPGAPVGPFGGPSSAPPSPIARTDDNGMPIPGQAAPVMPAQGGRGMFAGDLPGGRDAPLGGTNPQFMDILRKLPPQIGMPLLLQTMQGQMGGGKPHAPIKLGKGERLVDDAGRLIYEAPDDPEKTATPLTPEEVAALGLPKGTVAQKLPNGQISIVNKPENAAARKYDTVNGVAGWIDPEKGFVPDPNAPKQRVPEGEGNKPPQGYRWTRDGALEPIKGGPADPNRPGIGVGRRTEDQAKNTQLYTRAKEQLPIVLDNFDSLGTVQSAIADNIPGIGGLIGGEKYQRADGALKDIAASYLYSVSGATATPSEIAGTVERVRPKATDSAATKADKKKRIQDMVESIKYRAGGESSNAAQPAAAPEGVDPQVWQFMTPQERALWQN